MFDATAGRATSAAKIEASTDQLAADVEEFLADPTVSSADKEAAIAAAAAIFRNRGSIAQLGAGTFAQSNSGQPAAQLTAAPASAPTPVGAQAGLQAILDDPAVDDGIKKALQRLLIPTDPAHIPVGRDGTPSELVATRQERDTAKQAASDAIADKDRAEKALKAEQDPDKTGSLAAQLKAAQAVPVLTPQAFAPVIQEIDTAVSGLSTSWASRDVNGLAQVKAAVDKLASQLGMSTS